MATGSGNLKLIGQLSTVGLSFVFALVLGFGGGHLLDGWLGTGPWLAFLGFFVGLAAGVLNVYRILGAVGSTGSTGSTGSAGSAGSTGSAGSAGSADTGTRPPNAE